MKWNNLFYSLLLLFLSVLCAPAPTVNFSSPPFNPLQFKVNAAANDISILNSSNTVPIGVYPVKIRFQTGTNYFSIDSTSVPDGYALLSTNGTVAYFQNSGGGGGTSTNLLPLNNTWTGTNTWTSNTNEFSFALHAGSLYVGSGLFSVNTAGNLRANSIIDAGSFSADGGQFFSDGIGNVTAMSFSGIGTSLTALNASQITSGTVPVARLPVATTSTPGILRPDNTTITISGGIITAIGSSSTVTNISGGVGISVTQAGGTNFVAITGIVVTNAIYTNAGPNFTLNNTLVLNTNGFGGSGSSATNYVLNFGGSGTNEVFWNTFVMTNFASGNGITFDGTSFLLSGINLNTVGAGSIGGNGAGLIHLNGSGIDNGTVSTAFLQSNVLTNLVATNASVPSIIGHTGFIPTNSSSSTPSIGGITRPTFLFSTNVNSGANGAGAAFGDFNGDGLPDIVVGQGVNLFTYTNLPSAAGFTFPLCGTVSSTFTTAGRCAVADFNGDGKLDAVALDTGAGNFQVFTNNGIGILTKVGSSYSFTGPGIPLPMDVNGDGKIDLVIAPNIGASATLIYTNDGNAVFTLATTLPTYLQANSFQGINSADMNGDGKPDLLFGTPSTGLVILTNNGTGTFTAWLTNSAGLSVFAVTPTDLNGDGLADLAYNIDATAIVTFTNNGSGFGLTSSNRMLITSPSAEMVAADYTSDGKPDLVFMSQAINQFILLTNSGTGGFGISKTNLFGGGSAPRSLSALDFNGDGFPDVAVGSGSSGYAQIYLNTPLFTGNFIGNGNGITNGNASVSFSSSAVTPANSFTAGTANFGNISINTNYFGPTTALGFNVLAETGTTAGTAATAGKFGEAVQSLIAVGSAVSIATTATPVNITSISLTAGDWDVYANANIKGNTTANYNSALACINTVSATMVADGSEVPSAVTASTFSANDGISITCKQINVSATTTVYLVVQATFTANAPSGYGKLFARRVSR